VKIVPLVLALAFLAAGTAELHESGGYVHRSVSRVQTLGCYAYQVDGIGFSYSIVFRAVAS
jgi:hypothetical protein